MQTTLNYQITYPPQAAPRPAAVADPNAPLYASEDGLVASLSSQECIFQIKRSGETHVMTFQVLQAHLIRAPLPGVNSPRIRWQ